ncbi:MAG TPA: DUF1634 domain-containing protein [Terriglobales bacterium]|nr:DUF1634 domain-containing protein [Terriglobales bacterium]
MSDHVKQGATAEENVYADVYRVLLGGMIVSSALFAVGLVLALLHPEHYPLTPDWVRSHYHLSIIWRGLRAFDPFTLMLVATALLILTPVLRVVISIFAFVEDRDWKFVVVTSIVLVVIVLSVVLSRLGLQ